tara:strand:+ start:720 stop:965 length:246 start_codon:yes stop_codon:yes gene_type:complete
VLTASVTAITIKSDSWKTEENDMRKTVEKVEKAYRNFLIERGLPQMSAYELKSEDFYDDYERRVITKFIELFEAIDSEKKS